MRSGIAKGHGRFHAAGFCFVASGGDYAAPDQYGFAAQLRIEHLLDRRKKRVHIDVDNVWNCFGARRFGSVAFFFARVFVKELKGVATAGKTFSIQTSITAPSNHHRTAVSTGKRTE